MVRAFQKGRSTQAPSSEVARVASSIKMKDAKKFASTKHKGLPEKKVKKESVEHVGNSDFRSSAEFMNTFAKLKRLRKKNDKIGTGNTGLPQGVAQTNRRGKMQGVEEAAIGTAAGGGAVTGSTSYTGPNKADRKVIKKMDNKKFAAKLADYEKNMDPKKREALKDKATKGMKFTHEGTSYGLYKGDGKPKMQFAGFVKKAKPDTKKKPVARKTGNPAFDDPSHHSNRKSLSRSEDTEVYWSSKALDSLDELNKKTLGSYVKKASTDMAIGAVKGDKDKVKKRHSGILTATDKITKEEVEELEETPKGDKGKSTATKQDDRSVRSYGTGYGRKYNAPARKVIHQMKRGVKKYKGEKENNDGSTKMTNFIDDRKSHFHRQGKSYDEPSRKKMKKEEVEVLDERQKDSDNQRLSQERGRSNYGKASVRNVRHTGEGGNAADPAERLVSMDKRHKAHKEKRGVKTLSKYKKVVKEEGYDRLRDDGKIKPLAKKNVATPGQGNTWKRPGNALDKVKADIRQKYGKNAIMGEALNPKLQAVQDKAKANVAKQAASAAAERKSKADSAAKFQAHKKSEMSKGKRPDQALDSWQKKKMQKENVMSFSDFLKEGNDRARMMSKAKNQTTGNIAADRGTDEKKNRASRKGLEKDLKKKGIGFKKSVGSYKYDDGSTGREVSYQTSPGKGMSKRKFGKLTRRLGRKHGQESVITKKAGKPARLHDTESKKPGKSYNLGKEVKKGKNPSGEGETSATKVRGGKLPKKTKPNSTYHYGKKK